MFSLSSFKTFINSGPYCWAYILSFSQVKSNIPLTKYNNIKIPPTIPTEYNKGFFRSASSAFKNVVKPKIAKTGIHNSKIT